VTTAGFLDLFGLESLQELPDLPSMSGAAAPLDRRFGWVFGQED
jgi:chromosome segregation and condensation protein ScpB